MDLIARIYTEYQDYLRSINRHLPLEGLTNEEIQSNLMLEIPKYVNRKEYRELDRVLGAALPEIDEKRYYKLRETKKKNELNFNDLRNIITWQLWITHFRDYFPNFRKELLDTLGNSTQYAKIKQVIFDRTRDYSELSPNDLAIYSNRAKPVEPVKPVEQDNENRKEGKVSKNGKEGKGSKIGKEGKVYKNALRLYEK